MSYQRVIPRDLFNEAKLLKCLGKLSLLILDGELSNSNVTDELIDGGCFQIEQDPDDGSIYCCNYILWVDNMQVELSSPLNSRDSYPLRVFMEGSGDHANVFDEEGVLTKVFLDFVGCDY
jgi:hypothetical protein